MELLQLMTELGYAAKGGQTQRFLNDYSKLRDICREIAQ